MVLTRRSFLAATSAAAVAPRTLWAGSTLRIGQMRIDTLSDGSLVLPGDFILGGMPQADMQAIMARYDLPADVLTPPCNVTLLRDGNRTVLFDAGAGHDFQPSAGKLAEALQALGVAPDEITDVVFSHAHPDHFWGVLDDFDEPVFGNATHLIGRKEFDYWTDPDTVVSIGEERASFAVGAARRLEAVAERMAFFEDGQQILPGVTARASFGHTPGHMSFVLTEGAQSAIVVGDGLGNHHVAFEQPGWPSGQDQDREGAARMRPALLDQIVAEDMLIIGFHLPYGGIGRADRMGDSYRFVSA